MNKLFNLIGKTIISKIDNMDISIKVMKKQKNVRKNYKNI